MATVDTVADMVDTAAGAAPHMDMVATAVTTVVSPKYDDCLHIETIIHKYIIFFPNIHSLPIQPWIRRWWTLRPGLWRLLLNLISINNAHYLRLDHVTFTICYSVDVYHRIIPTFGFFDWNLAKLIRPISF